MINWKEASKYTPTSVDKLYPGSPETPFVPCLVWVCHPEVIQGGIYDIVRWDTKNKCWYKPDMTKWFYEDPCKITHFCDDINIPNNKKG